MRPRPLCHDDQGKEQVDQRHQGQRRVQSLRPKTLHHEKVTKSVLRLQSVRPETLRLEDQGQGGGGVQVRSVYYELCLFLQSCLLSISPYLQVLPARQVHQEEVTRRAKRLQGLRSQAVHPQEDRGPSREPQEVHL